MDEKEIFRTALTLLVGKERRKYLDTACGDDAALRARVDQLLSDAPTIFPLGTDASGEVTEASGLLPNRDSSADISVDAEIAVEPAAASSSGSTPGKRLGDYELQEVVGRGGMGVVYKGFDCKLRRVVAIKTFSEVFASHPQARSRFMREAQAAAAVRHDNIVTIYAVDEQAESPYLVMEYIQGKSLQQSIDESGPLPIEDILKIGIQVASGLEAAHRIGIVHRDIKPANILLDGDSGRVKITDFGLARVVCDVGITQTGQVAGTPQFMSPEQAQGQVVDHRSDLFSLGSVLYSVCAGVSAFHGETAVAVLRQVCDDRPIPLARQRQGIPTALCAIIDKLMAKRPDDRFQTARDVAKALQELLDAYTAALQQQATRRPESSARYLRIPIVIAALLLATAAIWTAIQQIVPSPPPQQVRTADGDREAESPSPLDVAIKPAVNATNTQSLSVVPNLLLSEDYEWSTPVNLGPHINSVQDEEHATLANGGLLILFARDGRLLQSQREKLTDPFGPATELPGPVNGRYIQAPFVSDDGLRLWFASHRNGTMGMNDLWFCQRTSVQEPFSSPSNLGPPVCTDQEESTPWVSPDGLTLLFCSERPESELVDIYQADRKSTDAPFSTPKLLDPQQFAKVNGTGYQFNPRMTADGLAMLFTSKANGRQSFWLARRPGKDQSFAPPIELPRLINQSVVASPAISSDGGILVFESNRSGGLGKFDLWESRRVRKAAASQDEWESLIQGNEPAKSGRKQGGATWSVADSILRGDVDANFGKLTVRSIGPNTFHLRGEARLVGKGNSGFDVLLQENGQLVRGYHIDLGERTAGSIAQLVEWKILETASASIQLGTWFQFEIIKTKDSLRCRIDDRDISKISIPDLPEVVIDLELDGRHGPTSIEFKSLQQRKSGPEQSANLALEFDGKTSYATASSLICDADTEYTAEAWIRPESQSLARVVMLLSGKSFVQIGKTVDRLFPMTLDAEPTAQNDNPLFVSGEWIHIAIVRDASELRLYLNGTNRVSRRRRPMPVGEDHTFGGLWIAGHPVEPAKDKVAYLFLGGMDEIRVSRISRYQEDFKPQLRFETDSDTLVLYHCDEGTGDELKDSSGNNHHARIIKPNWKPRLDQ